jgi:phospholipase C
MSPFGAAKKLLSHSDLTKGENSMHNGFNKRLMALTAALCIGVVPASPVFAQSGDSSTTTSIKHVVVIFQENVSFDHYFGTYPHAQPNADNSVYFRRPSDDTPRVNGLESSGLLTNNPNANNPANGATRSILSV